MSAAKRDPKPRARSGPTQTEEARAAKGMRQLKLRVDESVVERLDALCETSGFSRSEQVEALIDAETQLGPRKTKS